ncbi:MAG: Xaa-Pro peptidase family protein [Anaerolineales bacterium]|nr:Xaa-Pro peptidase family protein [Anaerolineales bacterium]
MSKDVTETLYTSRHAQLAIAIQNSDLDVLALNPGKSLTYLTGLHFHLSERPVLALFVPHTPPIVVLPELEALKIESLDYPVQAFPYGEDPETWGAVFHQASQAAKVDGRRVGVEPRCMRVLELRLLETSAPQAEILSGEEILVTLRVYKDEAEIASMRAAVDIAQRSLQATLPNIKAGMSERQLASDLTLQLLRHGSEPEIPFSPIVASGPNSANPHVTPSDRVLTQGDLLVIDWGATVNGYVSDLTRTFAIGEPDPELARIAEIVVAANAAARQVAAPGVRASDVDKAARAVIEQAGYGKFFTHRTGHGLGLEGHEEPYIRGDNDQLLEEGMTFTIEPGIYLPDRGGVRVEDDFVITSDGGESLSNLHRQLRIIE